MELTNEQRKYLGLEIIEPAWERVEIPSNCLKPELSTGKDILFQNRLHLFPVDSPYLP